MAMAMAAASSISNTMLPSFCDEAGNSDATLEMSMAGVYAEFDAWVDGAATVFWVLTGAMSG